MSTALFLLNPLLYALGIILAFAHPYHLAVTLVLASVIAFGFSARKRGNALHVVWALITAALWRVLHLATYYFTYKTISAEQSTYTWNIGEGMPSMAQAGWPSPLMLPPGAGGADMIPFGQLLWAYHNEMAALIISAMIAFVLLRWALPKKTIAKLSSSKPFFWTTIVLAVLAHLAFNGSILLWFD